MSFISQIKLISAVFCCFVALMLVLSVKPAFAQTTPSFLNSEVYDRQNGNNSSVIDSQETKSQVEVLENFLEFYPDLEDIEELEKSVREQQEFNPQSQISQEGVENLSLDLLERGG